MKLAGKLILVFIAIMIAVTALSSHFTSQQYFAHLRQEHRQLTKTINGLQFNSDLHDAIRTGDQVFLEEMVRNYSERETVLRWTWNHRETNESSTISEPGNPTPVRPPVYGEQTTLIVHDAQAGRKLLVTRFQMVSDGRPGAFEIKSPMDQVDSQSRRTWLLGLLSIGAMSLLGIGLVMTLGVRWIARPLQKLTDKMNRVGEGDFASDLQIKSKDELGHLAGAVNKMCDRLQEQQATIVKETEQRIQANMQLRHADRLKTVGQLAAGLAHEVGTPLNVISGRASMIISDSDMSPAKVRENTAAIKTESERISAIIAKLLDFARRSPSHKNVGDLRDVIRRAVDLIEPLAKEQRVSCELKLPEVQALANFDFNQMQQVLMNLIDNSVEASSSGQTVTISLEKTRHETTLLKGDDSLGQEFWSISVADTGDGIPPQHRDVVFEPFFTTKPVGSGTGLGLSIAYGIVEEHEGNISIVDQAKGTRFVVQLPIAHSDI